MTKHEINTKKSHETIRNAPNRIYNYKDLKHNIENQFLCRHCIQHQQNNMLATIKRILNKHSIPLATITAIMNDLETNTMSLDESRINVHEDIHGMASNLHMECKNILS